MRKVIIIGIIVLSMVFISGSADSQKQAKDETSGKYRLIWNDDPSTTITVAWDQGNGSNPQVYYGEEDLDRDWEKYPFVQKPTRIVPDYRGMNTHFAELADLKPDHIYYLVIRDNDYISARFWFKTAPDQPKSFSFIAGGDTKSSGAPLTAGRLSHRMVAKLRPLFVLFNGDFCTGDGTDDDRWQLWLNDWTSLTTTNDGRLIPIVPVHGNHEDGDSTVLNKLFNAPCQNKVDENVYYSLSFGGELFHLIALNSQIDDLEAQTKWLDADLNSHQHYTFKLAGYHKPFRPHTAKKRENDHLYNLWAPLFFKYGLDISVDGDSHMSKITFPLRPSKDPGSYAGFIRDDQDGTMYIGEGSWGAAYRPNNDDKPWTLRSGSFNQIKWIHVHPANNVHEAYMEIRTIITSERKKDDWESVISYVENVPPLSEEDVFAIPENIKFFAQEPYGPVIKYPFNENDYK